MGVKITLLSKIPDVASSPRGTALSHHEFDIETKDTFPLAPLGERGDRKAEGAPRSACCGGEGVFTKMEFFRRSSNSKGKREK